MQTDNLLLAGDIGGTKTVLALYPMDGDGANLSPPLQKETYQNNRTGNLEQIIAEFLEKYDARPKHTCLGIAGPVLDGKVFLTNLSWHISAAELQKQFNFDQVYLINDLVATAMGATQLSQADLMTINEGKEKIGTIAVLAPGTGLGEAFLVNSSDGLLPLATEGGHTSFSPRNKQQIALLEYMLKKHDSVSMEQVCAGVGLPNLFAFMQSQCDTPVDLAEALTTAEHPNPVLVKAALKALEQQNLEHIAVQTLFLFVDILAEEAANLALKTMSLGGIFIGGGIPPRILPFLQKERFLSVFCRGILDDLLKEMPIKVILNAETALHGAAIYGLKQAAKKR